MLMFTRTCLRLLLLLLTGPVLAHNGSVRGAVYDQETRQPLAGASVVLGEGGRGTATDEFGAFSFKDLPAGTYTLTVTFLGYAASRQPVEVRDGEVTPLTVRLTPASLSLSEVAVSGGGAVGTAFNTISAVDVKLRPTRSAQDLLRMVPGLFIAQHAGGGKAEQIFLRGFDIDHGTDINLTVDGMPVNMVSHAHGQGYSDLHFLIPETLENLDFGKGPYYTDQGDFTTAGYVRFQTRNALRNNLVKLEGGQFGTYRAVALLDLLGEAARGRNQHAYVASEYLYSDGYFQSPQHFNRLNLMGKYSHYLDNNKHLSFSLSTFRSQWDASGQIPQRAVDRGLIGQFGAIDDTEGGNTRRTSANLNLLQGLPDGATVENQLYFIRYDFELYSNFTFFANDPVNGDQIRQREGRNLFGYQGTYQREDLVRGKRLQTRAGLGLRHDAVEDSELSRTRARRFTTAPISLGDIDQTNGYAFLDASLVLAPQWTLNGGVRVDAFQFAYADKLDSLFSRRAVAKATVSPKLNLFYDPAPALRLFVNTGIGFHSNDTRVVVARRGQQILPKAYGVDVGAVFKPVPRLLVNVALWRLDLDQEFVYVGDEGIVEPSGRTRRYGADLSVRYQLRKWLFADADVNLTRPRALGEEKGSDYIPLAPTLTAIGGLSYRLGNGLNGSLRYRYLADRPANEDNSVVAQGYLLLDAVVNYTRPRYELSLSVENLTDRPWREAQFDTESRLQNEPEPVSEIHFTPGTPFFARASLSYFF